MALILRYVAVYGNEPYFALFHQFVYDVVLKQLLG